jgi:hypothetical protein
MAVRLKYEKVLRGIHTIKCFDRAPSQFLKEGYSAPFEHLDTKIDIAKLYLSSDLRQLNTDHSSMIAALSLIWTSIFPLLIVLIRKIFKKIDDI